MNKVLAVAALLFSISCTTTGLTTKEVRLKASKCEPPVIVDFGGESMYKYKTRLQWKAEAAMSCIKAKAGCATLIMQVEELKFDLVCIKNQDTDLERIKASLKKSGNLHRSIRATDRLLNTKDGQIY